MSEMSIAWTAVNFGPGAGEGGAAAVEGVEICEGGFVSGGGFRCNDEGGPVSAWIESSTGVSLAEG